MENQQQTATQRLSAMLKQQVHPQILSQSEDNRRTLAVAQDGTVGSYSLVFFNKDGTKEYSSIHQEIMSGKFIGETFKNYNIPFERVENCLYVTRLSPKLKEILKTQENEAFVISADCNVGPKGRYYATVLEVYSPVISFPKLFEHRTRAIRATHTALETHLNRLDIEFSFDKSYYVSNATISEVKEKSKLDLRMQLSNPRNILIAAKQEGKVLGHVLADMTLYECWKPLERRITEIYVTNKAMRTQITASLTNTASRILKARREQVDIKQST